MEFTREIYWNVGHGVTTLLPMYILTFAAIAILISGFVIEGARMAVTELGSFLAKK